MPRNTKPARIILMKFSLIHPSRGRPEMALSAYTEWLGKASTDNQYEYILSVDVDDPTLELYKKKFDNTAIKWLEGSNRSLIDAVNSGASQATGDILIVVSDDFGCPDEWDKALGRAVAKAERAKGTATGEELLTWAYAIHINDDITTREQRVMTLPILSRAAYHELGHIYNPIYFSMWADNELYEACDKRGWLIHSDLVFPHNHWMNNKRDKDKHDQRQSSQEAYNQGLKIFNKRREEGFN